MPSGPATPPARPPGSQGPSGPRITLIGRPGCHLCDDARAVIERVAADLDVGWTEVSVLDDPQLLAAYAEEIPVTLVDGRRHDYFRVDEGRLRAALAQPPA